MTGRKRKKALPARMTEAEELELLRAYLRKLEQPDDWPRFLAYVAHFTACDECDNTNCSCCSRHCQDAPWWWVP